MAKPLNEVIASSRSDERVTVETLRRVIAETKAEAKRQAALQANAEADSTDIALSDADRDESAANAARAARLVKAYADAIEDLESKLERKLESNGRKAAEAEKAAALAERDEIAGEMREFVPGAMSRLTALLSRAGANADRLQAAGLHVRDAEAEARDVLLHQPGVESFAKLKIPAWNGSGRAWPPVANVAMHQVDYGAARDRAAKDRAKAQERQEAQYGWYRLTNRSGLPVFFESRSNPRASAEDVDYCGRPWEGQMHHDMARKLAAKPEIEVEPIEGPGASAQ